MILFVQCIVRRFLNCVSHGGSPRSILRCCSKNDGSSVVDGGMLLHPGGRLISPTGLLVDGCGVEVIFFFAILCVVGSPNAVLLETTSVQTLAITSCGTAGDLSSGFGA